MTMTKQEFLLNFSLSAAKSIKIEPTQYNNSTLASELFAVANKVWELVERDTKDVKYREVKDIDENWEKTEKIYKLEEELKTLKEQQSKIKEIL